LAFILEISNQTTNDESLAVYARDKVKHRFQYHDHRDYFYGVGNHRDMKGKYDLYDEYKTIS
jgi:hypothetical protein